MTDESGKAGTGGAWLFGIVAGLILIALIIAAYSAGLDKGREEAKPAAGGGARTQSAAPAPTGPGRQVFVSNCGSCHTLSAAGTDGKVGPNLDDLRPDAARVLAAIRNGGTGSGAMPKGLVSGQQAQQVADYVGGAAGS